MSYGLPEGAGYPMHTLEDFYQSAQLVTYRKSLRCPCVGIDSGSPFPSCRNCGGLGFSYVNSEKKPVLLTNSHLEESWMSSGDIDAGTCKITALANDGWAKHDIFSIEGCSFEYTSDSLYFFKNSDGFLTAYTHYPIEEIEYLGVWKGVTNPYIQIPEKDYKIDKNLSKITLDGKYTALLENDLKTGRAGRSAPESVDERSLYILGVSRYMYQPVFEVIRFDRSLDFRPSDLTVDGTPQEGPLFVLMYARRLYFEERYNHQKRSVGFLNNDYQQ